MKGLMVVAFLAFTCFTLGQALDCNFCNFRFFGTCWFSNTTRRVSCLDANQRCGEIKAYLGGYLYIYSTLGCLAQCPTTPTTDQTTSMRYNISCCDTSLCNSGPGGAQLSLLSGAGILSLWLLTLA